MGPFVFGFASLDLYKSIQSLLFEKDNCFFSGFSDDAFIAALYDDCIAAFKLFLTEDEKCA